MKYFVIIKRNYRLTKIQLYISILNQTIPRVRKVGVFSEISFQDSELKLLMFGKYALRTARINLQKRIMLKCQKIKQIRIDCFFFLKPLL